MARPKAYFINGGAGRVLCSVPAFEKLAEREDDFIIVCEAGMDLFKGHPVLHDKAYDNWHKGLFEEHIKHRDLVSPEPYRVWEYYNQKCSIAQAFDIIINNEGIRELPDPTLVLNKMEVVQGYNIVQEVKAKTGFDKAIVIQPFGRGVQNMGEFVVDPGSRSMHLSNVIEIVNTLKKEYAVIMMSEFPVAFEENENPQYPVAMPQIPDIRVWGGIIEVADHFIGCDSVGQHIAKALGKTATIILGSTYPINISYPNSSDFDIIDLGEGKRRYSPIRISMEDHIERANDEVMEMSQEHVQQVINSAKKRLGKSTKFKGTFKPVAVPENECCSAPVENKKPMFSVADGTLKPLEVPKN